MDIAIKITIASSAIVASSMRKVFIECLFVILCDGREYEPIKCS